MEEDYSTSESPSSTPPLHHQAHILDNIYVRAGLILVYALIFLICFLGNLTVILVVTLQWKARLLSKFYLGNLAAANLSVALFCIPQNLFAYLLERWIFGELMCKMFHYVTSLCYTASILSLVVVSVERYLALLHAFKGRQVLTVRRIKVVLVIIWLLSAGVSLPRFFYFGLVRISTEDKGSLGEICVPEISNYNSATADTVYFIVLYALPLAVMSVMYLRIGMYIRKSDKIRNELNMNKFPSKASLEDNNNLEQRGNMDCTNCSTSLASKPFSSAVFTCQGQRVPVNTIIKAEPVSTRGFPKSQVDTLDAKSTAIGKSRLKKLRLRCRKRQSLVRMLKSIVVTFALLNLPYHVRKFCVNFLPSFDMFSDLNSVIAPLTFVLMYANCAANPILYVLMSSRFRRSLRDLIRKLCGCCSRSSVSL